MLAQQIVQWLLRGGLAVSVVLMAVGLVMNLAAGTDRSDGVEMFALGAATTAGDTVMAVGVLVLAATPALRVFALVVLWALERDWRFVGVAVSVVAALCVAVLVGNL